MSVNPLQQGSDTNILKNIFLQSAPSGNSKTTIETLKSKKSIFAAIKASKNPQKAQITNAMCGTENARTDFLTSNK